MSNPDTASVPPTLPPSSAPPPRNGCLTAFMVLAGIVMLLPGLCALIFGFASLSESHYDSGFTPFIVVGLLVGFAGIMLIRAAIRGGRP
jgi:uncharacterized membrane protein YjjB (DUF3815 family)